MTPDKQGGPVHCRDCASVRYSTVAGATWCPGIQPAAERGEPSARYEAHITFDKQYAGRLMDGFGSWTYSAIDDDPIMGRKPYCYLTAFDNNPDSLKVRADSVLKGLGIPGLRLKIERIVFDSKTGYEETTPATGREGPAWTDNFMGKTQPPGPAAGREQPLSAGPRGAIVSQETTAMGSSTPPNALLEADISMVEEAAGIVKKYHSTHGWCGDVCEMSNDLRRLAARLAASAPGEPFDDRCGCTFRFNEDGTFVPLTECTYHIDRMAAPPTTSLPDVTGFIRRAANEQADLMVQAGHAEQTGALKYHEARMHAFNELADAWEARRAGDGPPQT